MLRKFFGLGNREKVDRKTTPINSNIDINCYYCPKCGDEYRSNIAQCASCNVALNSGSDKLTALLQEEKNRAARTMDISINDHLITVYGGKVRELKAIRYLLAKESIPAILTGDGNSKG